MAEKKHLDNNGLLYLWTKLKAYFVKKDENKVLSTNDYTNDEKKKLSEIETGANKTIVEDVLTSDSTTNALSAAQGKALLAKFEDVYNKEQVDDAIAKAGHLKREIVTSVPTVLTAKENVIYMLKVSNAVGDDKYKEYMLIDGQDGTLEIVQIGDTSTDLTDYMKTGDLVAISNTEIDAVLATQ